MKPIMNIQFNQIQAKGHFKMGKHINNNYQPKAYPAFITGKFNNVNENTLAGCGMDIGFHV